MCASPVSHAHVPAADVRSQSGLPADAAAILVCDGAPAHNPDLLERVSGDDDPLEVFKCREATQLYVVYTLPGRSHVLQVWKFFPSS